VSEALTATPWLAVLSRIVKFTDDDTKRVLAQMLYEIVDAGTTKEIDDILDAYAYRLLGSL
jgi:hypothetical protein